jgi:hypothetical protein
MKYTLPLTLSIGLCFFCACTMFEAKQPASPPVVPKTLAVPIGKNWQIIEEAPNLTNSRHEQLPFQTEQSVQPAGAQPVSPAEQRKIETPR